MELYLTCRNQTLTMKPSGKLVEKSLNYIICVFDFQTDDWDGTLKTAVFENVNGDKYEKLIVDGICKVPYEVTQESGKIKISVYGTKEDYRITSGIVTYKFDSTLFDGNTPTDPEQTVYEQILSELAKIGATSQIELQKSETAIQWRYVGETEWKDLVQLEDITGPAGENGKGGANGQPGADGAPGKDGTDGKDGITPHIGDNGNWYIGDTDTGVKAEAPSTDSTLTESGKAADAAETGRKIGELKSDLEKLSDNYFSDTIIKPESGNYAKCYAYDFIVGHTYRILIDRFNGEKTIAFYTRLTEDGGTVEAISAGLKDGCYVDFTPTQEAKYLRVVSGTTSELTFYIYDRVGVQHKIDDLSENKADATDIYASLDFVTGSASEVFKQFKIISGHTYVIENLSVHSSPINVRSYDNYAEVEIITTTLVGGESCRFTATYDASQIRVVAGYDDTEVKIYDVNCIDRRIIDIDEKVDTITDSILEDKDISEILESGSIPLNVAIGTVVSGVRKASNIFISLIVECNTGDVFSLTGNGGSTPRLWGFLDTDYKLYSVAPVDTVSVNLNLEAEKHGYFVCNVVKSYQYSVIKKKASNKIDILSDKIDAIKNKAQNRIFGDGISCKYNVSNIPELNTPTDRLSYFYGLYDGLVSQYPNYVTKVDCDAEMESVGITVPSYMSGYPIYMYKFIPDYTPSYSQTEAQKETLAVRNKVLITTGTHPEYTSIFGLYNAMKIICKNWKSDDNLRALRFDTEYYIIPCASPYGVQEASRTNYNGVDPNRNMPTKNWVSGTQGSNTYGGASAGSEYESKVLIHYLDTINPVLYVDHHNFNTGSSYSAYITSINDLCISIGTHYISKASARWNTIYTELFADTLPMLGYCKKTTDTGTRVAYACEKGISGFTLESCDRIGWSNGVFNPDAYQVNTSVVETIATDCILNFLLCALYKLCNN